MDNSPSIILSKTLAREKKKELKLPERKPDVMQQII
jgi:hypothetical protein